MVNKDLYVVIWGNAIMVNKDLYVVMCIEKFLCIILISVLFVAQNSITYFWTHPLFTVKLFLKGICMYTRALHTGVLCGDQSISMEERDMQCVFQMHYL